jgi:hypothetical protein
MSPKKRPAKEPPVEGPSQAGTDQDHNIIEVSILTTHIPQTNHPHISTESHTAAPNTRRYEGPNTAIPYLPPQNSQDPQLEAEVSNDQHQDSEEEIKAIIENELTRLCQENERLRLEQKHMVTQRATM